MKNENKLHQLINTSNKILKVLYILFIIIVILVGVKLYKELHILSLLCSIFKVLIPVLIGFITAWLFNPLVKNLYEKKVPKILSSIIIYIVLILLIFLFFKVFIPVLYNQLNDLITSLPKIINNITNILDNITIRMKLEGLDVTDVKNNILNSINIFTLKIASSIPKNIVNIVLSLFGSLGIFSIGLVIGVYMLIDFDNIYNNFINLIPNKYQKEITALFNKISLEVRKTVNGTFLVALMVLLCDTVAFTVIGLESPLLFGVLCGITDLIPYIGPYIGGAAAVVVGFSSGTKIGIATLIVCIVVQLVENYIFQPIVMSKAIEIHPIIVIIGLLLFGHFFGIVGMILATPILALLKVIYEYVIIKVKESS